METLIDTYHREFIPLLTLDPEMAEVLDYLDTLQVPYGVVTNGLVLQLEKLRQLNLHNRLACTFVSDILDVKKPDPAIFQAALDALNMPASRTLFVGDHPLNDIRGAAAVGMKTAWVSRVRTWQTHDGVVPDFLLDQPGDLLTLVTSLFEVDPPLRLKTSPG